MRIFLWHSYCYEDTKLFPVPVALIFYYNTQRSPKPRSRLSGLWAYKSRKSFRKPRKLLPRYASSAAPLMYGLFIAVSGSYKR